MDEMSNNENVRERKKPKKRFKKFLFVVIILLALLFIAGYLLSDDGWEYSTAERTPLTEMTDKLASSGVSMSENYKGKGLWGVPQETENLRKAYTNTKSAESVTMMVYMIGSNLESEGSAATEDLQEMIASNNGKALNVVVETGGAKEWTDKKINPKRRQRWLIQNGEMTLKDEKPQTSMCTPESLTDFISWSANTYPADRYMLVLWDHGGGTMCGYGCDELFPDDTLELAEMVASVKNSGIKLDIVSFDACLMGTLEIAYAFEPVADYLLASEETEPSCGWYYTNALSELAKNPSMSTPEFGARLIDSYTDAYRKLYYNQMADLDTPPEYDEDEENQYASQAVTLSLVDLREVPQLYMDSLKYYAGAEQKLSSGQEGFTNLSYARSSARSFGDNEYEQIDLIDYVQRTGVEGAENLIRSAFSAIKYRNNSTLEGSYGLAVYFPYSNPEYYSDVMKSLEEVDYTGGQSFYNSFLSVLAGGTGGNRNKLGLTPGQNQQQDLTGEDWYDEESSSEYDYQSIANEDELTVNYSEKYDAYLLSLPDNEWESIMDIQLQVMLDDGEGYLDLGSDQQFDWTSDDELILDFDDTWVSIDGQLAAFYADTPVEDGDYTLFTGTTPALLNDETYIDIYLQWRQDEEGNGTSYVLGYIPVDEESTARPKGYLEFKQGDRIQLMCDYYTYAGEYDDSYYLGNPITVTEQKNLKVDWYDLEESTVICWLRLTDWFNQDWYTETIEISYE